MRAASFLWLIVAFLLGIAGFSGPHSPEVVVLIVVFCAGMSTLTLGIQMILDALGSAFGLRR